MRFPLDSVSLPTAGALLFLPALALFKALMNIPDMFEESIPRSKVRGTARLRTFMSSNPGMNTRYVIPEHGK